MIRIAPPPPESREYGMLIPLSCVGNAEGHTVNAIPEAREAAEWLDSLSDSALFLPETFARLDEMLRPVSLSLGFQPDNETNSGFARVFSIEEPSALRQDVILADTVSLRHPEKYRYLTETALDENAGECVIFATVGEGQVLSFANLNSDDGETVEIGVETADGETGKGYGKSNVAALCRYFLKKGRRILYEAEESNPASVAIAKAVGMTETAKEYNYVCFLDE